MKKLVKESLNEGFATYEGRNIDKIAGMLGYDDFEEFIGDNPGCYEIIVNWIDETFQEKFVEEDFDPEELENLGLWQSAEAIKESSENEDDEEMDGEREEVTESFIFEKDSLKKYSNKQLDKIKVAAKHLYNKGGDYDKGIMFDEE